MVAEHIAKCWQQGYDDEYCTFAKDNFNFGVADNAMKWRQWENEFNHFNTKSTDAMLDWAEHNGWGFRAHCLFWAVDKWVHFPDWLYPKVGKAMVNAIRHRISTAMKHLQVNISSKPHILDKIIPMTLGSCTSLGCQ